VVLYCNILSKVEGAPDQGLILTKKGSSLPHIAVLDSGGNLLAVHEGEKTVDGFEATVERARNTAARLAALEGKARAGDTGAGADLLELRLDLRHVSAEVARRSLSSLSGLDPERREKISMLVNRVAFGEIFAAHVGKEIDTDTALERYEKLASTGAEPAPMEAAVFFYLIGENAIAARDSTLFKTAVDGIRSLTFEDPTDRENMSMALQYLQERFEQETSRTGG